MTPLPLSTPEEQSPPPSQADRPERSRNAKAQARHRAKRKAYIEQLEQTVTKLQYALSLSPDQVAVLPPPIVRIRELEEQNKELIRQIDELRTQIEDRNTRLRTTTVHRSHNGPVLPTFDDRGSDHDTVKRRRTVEGSDDLLIAQGPIQHRQSQSPLQVAIPREYHTYSPHTPSQHQSPATPMVSAPYALQYQFPETQTSSVTSSPSATSFSSESQYSPQMHGQHHPHDHTHAQRVHPASPSYPTVLHPYARAAPQYDHVVKIEEDAYPMQHGLATQPNMNGYSTALSSFGGNNPAMGNWHGYGDGA